MRTTAVNVPVEIGLPGPADLADVEIDVVFTSPGGDTREVPAFRTGAGRYRVRFAPPRVGHYAWQCRCASDPGHRLHGRSGSLDAVPYGGDNPLYRLGRLRRASDDRTLEHVDGTPFFWLADTWWMGLCSRLKWPGEYKRLTADRVAKGFSVIQIVAGLCPDMPGLDERGANEGGLPWRTGFSEINPAYFDLADRRIAHLVRSGLVPCIVGSWGYYFPMMGPLKMRRHWREMIARWAAYPVVWALAGEAVYMADSPLAPEAQIRREWTALGEYVHAADPFGNPVTIHPTNIGRDQVDDDRVLDFEMLQTGHIGYDCVPKTMRQMTAALERLPRMPVLNGEVNYEGLLHGTQDEMQRLCFWSCMLIGAAGHSYGANGIWQMNRPEAPFGPSPSGGNWGNTPWQEAYVKPGSRQVGLGRRLLERYPWWQFRPHQEWTNRPSGPENWFLVYAAGIPRVVRVLYEYTPVYTYEGDAGRHWVLGLEQDVAYTAYFYDPRTGQEHNLGAVRGNAEGKWRVPVEPVATDWVIVLEADGARRAP